MAIVVALSALIVWVVGAGLLVRAFHVRSWRIEASDATPPEQVYRLHRLIILAVAVTAGYALLGLAAFVTTSVTVDGPAGTHWVAVAVSVLGAFACVVPMIASVRVIRRAYARARGGSIRPHGRRYVLVLTVATAALLATGIAMGHAVFPHRGVWHIVGMLSVYLLILVAMQVLVAPLVIVSLGARQLPDDTRRRLRRLAARMGVRVRDIRAIPGRAQGLANAAQIGAVPGLRYIVVTDDLLEELEPEELDAVVAHELGHVRGHHLTVKLWSVFVAWAGLEAVFVGVNALTDTSSTVLLLVPVLLAFPVGAGTVQWLLGVRLEHRADDAAAGAVGGGRLASALEKIVRLNDSRCAETGRMWAALTQHPGLEERLGRLRRRVPAKTERAIAAP